MTADTHFNAAVLGLVVGLAISLTCDNGMILLIFRALLNTAAWVLVLLTLIALHPRE